MSNRIPILLMSRTLDIGGSERQTAEVAMALNRAEFEVHVGCFHSSGMRAADLRAAGVTVVEFPVRSLQSAKTLVQARALKRYIQNRRIALFHSFDVPTNIFGAPVARVVRGVRVLTSQRAHRSLTSGMHRRLLRIVDRLTDGIVVNCEYMRRHLVDEEKVPEGRIHLCYNGIDSAQFTPNGPKAGEAVGLLDQNETVIGTLCALRSEKGLLTLIDGFAAIASEFGSARLLIVGSGPELPHLEARVAELGLKARCTFIPATRQVAEWLRSIDIFVLPSLSEALSNALMEAMACGCCPVASDAGGNPELAGNPAHGMIFKTGDASALAAALRRLLADASHRKSLAQAASSFIRTGFSIPISTARMKEIYLSELRS